jgi:3-oxoacyl-[acyl-carrier protein] reductase
VSTSLANRVALVTGASRGLGAAIALELGKRGAAVAVNYWKNRERAEAVVGWIRDAGGAAKAFGGDVRDEGAVREMVREIEGRLGNIDVLVVNATGEQPMLPVEEITWDGAGGCVEMLEFFVKSPLILTQAVIGGMKARKWGRIIQIGSEVFEMGVPRFSHYVAAKGAQLGLTRSWAREFAGDGVTVNLVAPGWIPTERHRDVGEEERGKYVGKVPLGRFGRAEEVAAAVAYLASEGAGFVTGQKISVNGGNSVE